MLVALGKEWETFFNGASKSPIGARKEDAQDNVTGIRVLLVSPDNTFIPYSFSLITGCFINIAEYEAFTAGLELALQVPIVCLII